MSSSSWGKSGAPRGVGTFEPCCWDPSCTSTWWQRYSPAPGIWTQGWAWPVSGSLSRHFSFLLSLQQCLVLCITFPPPSCIPFRGIPSFAKEGETQPVTCNSDTCELWIFSHVDVGSFLALPWKQHNHRERALLPGCYQIPISISLWNNYSF